MKRAAAVVIWAIAFAYVEGAIVEYLRALYMPYNTGDSIFPLLTVEQLKAMGNDHVRRLAIEFGRELATIIMLASLGFAVGKNRREAWAYFLIAFGVWDVFYYFWLKVFLGWPAGLMTWDLLFLVPVPWVSPVAAPVIIAVTMVVCGFAILAAEKRGVVLSATWSDWALFTGGGIVVIISFCWDYENIMAGGTPNPFKWTVFFVGLIPAVIAFIWVVRRNLAVTGRSA